MGLFDKKYCDICGEKIGLLGNCKLDDGNLCKECAQKLSPWFEERRHSTVEEIKRQLAYREQNKELVQKFNVTRQISTKSTIGLIRRFPYVYGALGVHPDEVAELTEEDYKWLEKNIYKPKIVAVGEIGLDYHWNDNKKQQIEAFARQMDIAREAKLPIIVHSRDAAQDTFDTMKSNNAQDIVEFLSHSSNHTL